MPRFAVERFLIAIALIIALGACDRSELDDDGPPPPPNPPGQVSTCSARIDGEAFIANGPGASADGQGTTSGLTCGNADGRIIVALRPAGFGAATLALGGSGNQAQFDNGSEATNTAALPVGEDAGEVVFTTFTSSRAVGTFRISVPGFMQGAPIIRITEGRFDVAVQFDAGDG